jgi:hypothetical protein
MSIFGWFAKTLFLIGAALALQYQNEKYSAKGYFQKEIRATEISEGYY